MSWPIEHLSLNFTMDMDPSSIIYFGKHEQSCTQSQYSLKVVRGSGKKTPTMYWPLTNCSHIMTICYITTAYTFLNQILTNNLFFFSHMQVCPSSHDRFTSNCMENHILLAWQVLFAKRTHIFISMKQWVVLYAHTLFHMEKSITYSWQFAYTVIAYLTTTYCYTTKFYQSPSLLYCHT